MIVTAADTQLVDDFRNDLDTYLTSVEYCKVRNLEQLIAFNEAHRDTELPARM